MLAGVVASGDDHAIALDQTLHIIQMLNCRFCRMGGIRAVRIKGDRSHVAVQHHAPACCGTPRQRIDRHAGTITAQPLRGATGLGQRHDRARAYAAGHEHRRQRNGLVGAVELVRAGA